MTRKPARRPALATVSLATVSLMALALAGCGSGGWFGDSDAPPLPGERVAVLAAERGVQADPGLAGTPVAVPPATANAAWPQAGGGPSHAMGHLELSENPQRAWSVDVGTGSSGSLVLLGGPVAADGRIYVMDADSDVSALNASTGSRLWTTDLRPEAERGDAPSGGVAAGPDRLYAASGYAEVVALDPASGAIVWRKRVAGPVRGAPTVADGRVFVITIDNQLVALSAADGEELWTHTGYLENVGLMGAASPAVSGSLVVAPYSSGDLYGLRAENGRPVWQENLAAVRRGAAIGALADIRGLPVIDRGTIFAIGHSGRMMAIDERVGARLWEQDIAGAQTPWVAGETVYVVSIDSVAVAIDRATGRVRWATQLERYEDPDDRTDPVVWAGPVLAGSRLWLAGSNSDLVALDPATGAEAARRSLPTATFLPPIVAGGTMYVLSDNGTLTAFR